MLKKILFLLLGILIVSCEKESFDDIIIDEITDTSIYNIDQVEFTTHRSGPFTIKQSFQLLKFEDGYSPQERTTWDHVHGNINYEYDGEEYLFMSTSAEDLNGDGAPDVGNPILFKRVNGLWVVLKKFPDVQLRMVRNYDMHTDGVHFVIGDAPEYRPGYGNGVIGIQSNIYFGKIIKDDIEFTLVNPSNPVWAHDASIGDINQDGRLDVLSTGDGYRVWYQTSNGSFELDEDKVDYQRNWYSTMTANLADLNGDSKLEFITGVYNFQPDVELYNNLQLFSMDSSDGIYKKSFQSDNPHEFIQGEMGAGRIRTHDMDNDGLEDVIVQREGRGINFVAATEIWKNNGNGTFSRLDIFGTESEETGGHYGYEIMDINNDGYSDIALIGFHWGSELRLNPPYINKGFILNNLIWLNNGDGTFRKYNSKQLVGGEGFDIQIFYPVKIGNEFSYIGKSAEDTNDGIISKIFEIKFQL